MTSFSFLSFVHSMIFSIMLHPLHVSVTEIEFDEKDKALEIMMRVFVDDLELTMRQKMNQPELDITAPKGTTIDAMMMPYINDHLKITVDNKAQKLHYLGHEQEGEAFIFYVEVENIKKLKTVQVMNNIIMEIHDDQSNLVHVTVRGKVKSLRLTKDQQVNSLTFDAK